jgi:hypothetical protein
MGMITHASAGHLWACVNVDDYCDPSFTGTPTHVKSLENVCDCVSTTDCV